MKWNRYTIKTTTEAVDLISCMLAELGIEGIAMVRDLWRQKDLGEVNGIFRTEVPYHGVTFVKITPAKQQTIKQRDE